MSAIRSNAQIPIDDLLEDFHCPVCFEEIERCFITPCGHHFCEECLRECVNRRHACPLCGADCTAEQIIRNLQADSLLEKLRNRRQNAAEDHVAHLVDASLEEAKSDQPNAVGSPISTIFRKYTSQMLVQYENYYQQLLRDAEKSIHRATEQVFDEIREMFGNVAGGNQFVTEQDIKVNSGTVSLREALNAAPDACEAIAQEFCAGCASDGVVSQDVIQEIEVKLMRRGQQADLIRNRCNKSCQMLCQSYETYMNSMSPSLFLLPVKVTIRLRGRPQFWEIQLKNTDRLGYVAEFVGNKFVELADPIKIWEGPISFGLQRPLGGGAGEGLEIVANGDALIGELNVQPATQIHIMTAFSLSSEAPEACFTADFVKGSGQTCDYFRCNQCGLNWVCKGCANQCHRGHDIVSWEQNHVPSYACCYCAKKFECTLENSYKNKMRG